MRKNHWRQLLRLHQAVAALAGPLDHLLVGQYGLARGAPVDRRFLLVGETLLVELKEEPLRPFVVVGPAGDHLPGPVDGHAQPPELPVDGGDGRFGEAARRLPGLDGHVLGVQTEGVVPHGMKHPLPLVAAEAGDDVAHGVVLDVPHVRAARRVGEHLEDVGGVRPLAPGSRPPGPRPRRASVRDRVGDDEGLLLFPDPLPLGLDLLGIVLARHAPSFRSSPSLLSGVRVLADDEAPANRSGHPLFQPHRAAPNPVSPSPPQHPIAPVPAVRATGASKEVNSEDTNDQEHSDPRGHREREPLAATSRSTSHSST